MTRAAVAALGLLAVAACGPAPPPVEPPPPIIGSTPKPAQADRSSLPEAKSYTDWTLPAVATWKMDNGMRVWFLRQQQTPLISLRIVFPGGASTDPEGKAGLTGLMADMLDEGAGGRSALEINETLQRLATGYGSRTQRDAVVLSMGMLADKLVPSLKILGDIVIRPDLPQKELDRRQKYRIAEVISHEAAPSTVRNRMMYRVMFGEGYGGLPNIGLASTLRAIKRRDVKAQYAAHIKPHGATVVVVGDVERPALQAALSDAFGSWKGKPSGKVAAVAKPSSKLGAVYVADFPDATQSSIAVARRAAGTNAPDYFPALVFNRAFGGSFSSRLNLNLREDKGYTYGARSSFWRWRNAGLFVLSSEVKRETTKASLQEMFSELTQLGSSKLLSKTEYRDAIDGLLLGYPGRFERMSGVASQLARVAEEGRDANWLRGWPAKLKNASLTAAVDSARVYSKRDDFAVFVAGDKKVIAASLAELGMPMYSCNPEGACRPDG